MKIKSLSVDDLPPIKKISIDNLSDIVVIAGANGSGKTRLKDAIIQSFSQPQSPTLNLELISTRPEEKNNYWFSDTLSVQKGVRNNVLESYMNSRTRGGTYTGTIIHIDSDRQMGNVQFQALSLSTLDPDDSEMDYKWYLSSFASRWSEIVNRIYQKVGSRELKISKYCKENPTGQIKDALEKYPDPFVQYQETFIKLLPDKQLLPIDPKQPSDFSYRSDSQNLPFNTLSSGEKEVVKIAFYILSKKISHCVFLIDEPELHLHPTLSFRLIETLKELGSGSNQFIFFTHSADLISTYYSSGNVYFIDYQKTGQNQAHRLSDLINSHSTLVQLMSENLGLFAVGKKLIFVEGEQSSIDRLTYYTIAQKYFPEAHVIPIESVHNIMRLKDFAKEIKKTIFGIGFFMIRDRDGLSENQIKELEAEKRLMCLKKRHLENYFLDSEILAKVAQRFCLDNKWYNPQIVEAELKNIATNQVNFITLQNIKEYIRVNQSIEIPTIKSLQSKQMADIISEYTLALNNSISKHNDCFKKEVIEQLFQEEIAKNNIALQNESWKDTFAGKPIFEIFCNNSLGDKTNRVREAYVEIALKEKPNVFQDIIDIYKIFAQ